MRVVSVFLLMLCLVSRALAQSEPKLAFDVASIRESKAGEEQRTNVPLGPGDVYSPTGGQLNTRSVALLQYVAFAWRMTDSQVSAFNEMAPQWAKDARFDIQARTDKTDVTKDELRLMMRSLLQERFGLVVHYESRTASVYALQLVKANTLGPHFREHTGACSKEFKGNTTAGQDADGYPDICGGLLLLPGSTGTHFRIGASDLSMAVFVNSLGSWGDLGRPVVNDTGVTNKIDFFLDYIPPYVQATAGADVDGQGFQEALRKQLGLKLESQKQPVQVLVLDHIGRLTEN